MKFLNTSFLDRFTAKLKEIDVHFFYNPTRLIIVSVLAMLGFLISEPISKSSLSLSLAQQTLESSVEEFEKKVDRLKTEFFLNSYPIVSINQENFYQLIDFARENKIEFFIQDSTEELVFWSTEKAEINTYFQEIPNGYSFQKLNNGYYVVHRFQINQNYTLTILDWVKKDYLVENKLFSKEYTEQYPVSTKYRIDFVEFTGSMPIQLQEKNLFYIGVDEQEAISKTLNIKIVLWLIVVICLTLALIQSLREVVQKSNYWYALIYLLLFIIGIRMINVMAKLPKIWYYDWSLFSSEVFYLNATTPSLGDFILNSICFLWLVYFLYRNSTLLSFPTKRNIQYGLVVLFVLGQFFVVDYGIYCFKELTITSNIYLDVNNILSFNWLSFASYISLTIYFFIYYFYVNFLANYIKRFNLNRDELIITVAIGMLAAFMYQLSMRNLSIVYLTNIMYLIAVLYQKRTNIDNNQFRFFAILIIGFSLVSATKLIEYNEKKQERIQEQEAIKIEKIGLKKTTFDDIINNTSTQDLVDKSNFSYALFHKGELLKKVGDFNYNRSLSFKPRHKYELYKKDGYVHYVNSVSNVNVIIVSRKSKTFFENLSTFSFFFALSTLLYFVLISFTWLRANLAHNTFFGLWQRAKDSFRYYKFQIQLYIFSSVVLFISLLILITFNYIEKSFVENQKNNLLEKIDVIKSEVKNLDYNTIKSQAALTDYINTVARSFNIDIYCYDTLGRIRTNRNKGLNKAELISDVIKPEALASLVYDKNGYYISEDAIGGLEFFACYSLLEYQDEVIGYIFVPFYKNQNEYSLKLSTLANSLINIYVLIISLISFVSFFISQRLVEPIETLERLISKVKIGGINERIEWKRNDEFGKLIKEYNNMIDQLETNTQKLVKSEREGAWRQMAKQIAHEIKNPLTPLKLGLQHIERAYKNKSEQFDTIFNRFVQTFLNQINSLEHIVTQFSNFAQFSALNIEKLNVLDIVNNTLNLYGNQIEAEIELHIEEPLRCWVMADDDHLMRSIGNIVKNGIQAIPDDREGHIDIFLRNIDDKIEIEIKDNGTGITEEVAERIFEPNFTTKNSGMGLGLAIIQKSILEMGGTIRFKTILDKGTSFYITLPLCRE
jgi:signal transduction histidine kinase